MPALGWNNLQHFLDNYEDLAPFMGESYNTDNAEVHTYLIHFMAGAEAKIIAHGASNNGCADIMALKDHFEGVGI